MWWRVRDKWGRVCGIYKADSAEEALGLAREDWATAATACADTHRGDIPLPCANCGDVNYWSPETLRHHYERITEYQEHAACACDDDCAYITDPWDLTALRVLANGDYEVIDGELPGHIARGPDGNHDIVVIRDEAQDNPDRAMRIYSAACSTDADLPHTTYRQVSPLIWLLTHDEE